MSDTSLHQLNREWERLRLKYGIADSPPELGRLLLTSRRKRARLRDLRVRLQTIQEEVDVLDVEVAGIDKTLRFFLSDMISKIEVDHGPAWSPVPVMGFRVWNLREGGFYGYRVRWEHRSLAAECGTTRNQEDVPHTDGECANPPCGIYAAKDVDRIIEAHSNVETAGMAVGLVAMAGKVVEHEHGWRAKQVTVLALAFVRGGRVQTTDDPDEIELLFQGVGLSDDWNQGSGMAAAPEEELVVKAMAQYMKIQERKKTQWILESPDEL
ncbi:MAG: hypothetical protein WDZ96_02480 [Acidimicrobiia bacterium]